MYIYINLGCGFLPQKFHKRKRNLDLQLYYYIFFLQCGFFKRKELEELRRLIEQNAENEAMANMLGAQDDMENEPQFTFQLYPGAALSNVHPDPGRVASNFNQSVNHNPLENNGIHPNGFLSSLERSSQNGHIRTRAT